MSDEFVVRSAKRLNVTPEQFGNLWTTLRQEMLDTLREGYAVDLGFAYVNLTVKQARKRYDFGAGTNVVQPATPGLRFMVPPHVRDVLAGRADLSWAIWLSRAQFKQLPIPDRRKLASAGCSYYSLKGVTA